MYNESLQLQHEYLAKVYNQVESECRKLGLMCECKFGLIFIRTIYEEFYFEPVIDGKVRLMHRTNNKCRGSSEYHEQFRKYIKPKEVVRYIFKHTQWRFLKNKRT